MPASRRVRPVTARRRARELVLQGLYERQLAGSPDDAIGPYFRELWRGVSGGYDQLLATVAPKLDRKPGELAPIERALLVIGTWELVHRPDIPYRVVIDEAVEVAKSYGGTDGHKFVNGVLDKLAGEVRAAEMRAPANDE